MLNPTFRAEFSEPRSQAVHAFADMLEELSMSSNSESVLAWLRSALHEQMVERVQNFARLTRKRFESALRLAGVLEVQERGTHQYAQTQSRIGAAIASMARDSGMRRLQRRSPPSTMALLPLEMAQPFRAV